MPRILFRLAVWSLVTAACVLAQQPVYTLEVNVPWVTVDVTVTDREGKAVTDLTGDNFEVFENGLPQKIHSFAPVSAPYNILLLFDRSGSTEHKWPFLLRASAGFIANLRPQDRVAMDSFNFGFDRAIPWTYKRDLSVAKLSGVVRSNDIGGTAFYQAVETAVRNEFKKISGRRALVVLTDGRDTSIYREVLSRNRILRAEEDKPFQKLLRSVRDHHIPVYFVAINTDRNLEPNVNGGDEYRNLQQLFPHTEIPGAYLREVRLRMEQLAESSGGRVLYPSSIEDVVPMYNQIGTELGTAYSLAYIAENTKSDGTLRRIEVRTTDATLRLSQSRTSYIAK